MLNPKQDRLDYGQILSPPEGYQLDFAIGTTYSLDLDALVGVSLSLGLSEEPDSELVHNPVFLLEALRRTGDRVALFCEGGQIHMPGSPTPLYVLLEKMVFEVILPRHRGTAGYPSFHPKFWLIRYENQKGNVLYRAVVLSRNLTFDRSWDITFSMDGPLTREDRKDKNAPVSDFLRFLKGFLPKSDAGRAKGKKIAKMIGELPRVNFQLDSREFSDFDFMPVGVSKKAGGYYSVKESALFEDSFQELLIMSPFLSGSTIRDFNNRYDSRKQPEYMLITRAASLNRLKQSDCSHFDIYTLKDAVVDGESAISEEGAPVKSQDIHAKVYMTRSGLRSDLYLGSLNASHNASSGNVEFMICLHSRKKYLNLNRLRTQLFCGTDDALNPFQPAFPQEKDMAEDVVSALSNVIREIARMEPSAEAAAQGGAYTLSVHFNLKSINTDYSISVSPLLGKGPCQLAETVIFQGLSAEQLSVFYRITVSDGSTEVSRILKIPTDGLPVDREKKMIAGIVSSKSSFYQYISFLLGDSYAISTVEKESIAQRMAGKSRPAADMLPSLYEKMLRTAAEAPERLEEIGSLLRAVSADEVVPEHFEELYKAFQKAVKQNG